MKQLVILLTLVALPSLCLAEKGKSIMFGDTDPVYSERARDTTARQQAERCTQLREEINSLKGKPQRRNAAIQRYRLECEQNYQQPGQPRIQ